MPYSAQTIYDIVADIERYPEFLPYCEQLSILSSKQEESKTSLHADMTVGYKAIKETFRSHVTLDEANKTVITTNIQGPFKHLDNEWRIEAIKENLTDVHFTIDYAFKNWAMEKLMGSLFDKAFRTYAESFEARARALAGTPTD